MNNNIVTLLVVALIFLYVVVRQFTEQRVSPINLLLLPLLSAYASYTELPPIFAHFALLPLLGALAGGILLGLVTGVLRGRYTRVRLDSASGQIYSKPQWPSSLTWLALLVAHIAVIVLNYSSLAHLLIAGVLVAFTSSLFLVSVATQKVLVYLQANRLQSGQSGQPYGLRSR